MNRNGIIRITTLAAAIAVMALSVATNVARADKPFEGVNLRVGTFGGPWTKIQQEMLQPKMEALGATVTYVAGSPQTNMAKLIGCDGRVSA